MSLPVIGIIGAVVGGIGQALQAREERKAREREKIAEEKRAEQRYEGSGEASSIFGGEDDVTTTSSQHHVPTERPEDVEVETVGGAEVQKEINRATTSETGMRYDPATGKMVRVTPNVTRPQKMPGPGTTNTAVGGFAAAGAAPFAGGMR